MIEELNKYTVKDKKYTTSAITVTISKFGPSGSLKNTNIILEQTIDVMAKISNEIFFDLKYIVVIISGIHRLIVWFEVVHLIKCFSTDQEQH